MQIFQQFSRFQFLQSWENGFWVCHILVTLEFNVLNSWPGLRFIGPTLIRTSKSCADNALFAKSSRITLQRLKTILGLLQTSRGVGCTSITQLILWAVIGWSWLTLIQNIRTFTQHLRLQHRVRWNCWNKILLILATHTNWFRTTPRHSCPMIFKDSWMWGGWNIKQRRIIQLQMARQKEWCRHSRNR